MIYSSEFRLDQNKREIIPSYSEDFPFVCMDASMDHFIGRGWHWHPAFEIDYVIEGALDFRTPEGTIHLKKGDMIFINSNVMHAAYSAEEGKRCRIYAVLFGNLFLSGMYGSLLEQKYISPILNCRNFTVLKISPDTPANIHMIEFFLQIVELAEKEETGYEFEVRSVLGRLWCIILGETEEIRKIHRSKNQIGTERLREMLKFIHENYMDKISVIDVSNIVNISERECNRCFKKYLNITPADYLRDYRVSMSVQMLMYSNESIWNISDACGFSSVSYFGKVFREKMGCTPREYRSKKGALLLR